MLIADASCLFEVVTNTPIGHAIGDRLARETSFAAPHVIDVEVAGIVRGAELRGLLDRTAAGHAIVELQDWPGERFAHQLLLPRVWELRHNVRGWDAFYVALAEALDAPLLTLDRRLAGATGPRCHIEVAGG